MSLNSYVLTSGFPACAWSCLPASTSLRHMLDPAINYKTLLGLDFKSWSKYLRIPYSFLGEPTTVFTEYPLYCETDTAWALERVYAGKRIHFLKFGRGLVSSEDDIPDDDIHCSSSLECVLFISLSELRLGRTLPIYPSTSPSIYFFYVSLKT